MALVGNEKRQRSTYWCWGERVRCACKDWTTRKPDYCRCSRVFWAEAKMLTFCTGKLPMYTADDLAELRLHFLGEDTVKFAERLKLFVKNQYLCHYGGKRKQEFGPGSVRTEPSSTHQWVKTLVPPWARVGTGPRGLDIPRGVPSPGWVLVS